MKANVFSSMEEDPCSLWLQVHPPALLFFIACDLAFCCEEMKLFCHTFCHSFGFYSYFFLCLTESHSSFKAHLFMEILLTVLIIFTTVGPYVYIYVALGLLYV